MLLGLAGCALCATACAPTLGAAQHDAAAVRAEGKARQHETHYLPGQREYFEDCPMASPLHAIPCWSRERNPGDAELRLADQDRQAAAAHRKASLALRAAEARACSGLADKDRDRSPLSRADEVARVLLVRDPWTETQPPREVAALIFFQPLRDANATWLQQVVDCHLARNAALGPGAAPAGDPLGVEGVQVHAGGPPEALYLFLDARTPAGMSEVATRSRRLGPTEVQSAKAP